jgi:hypothetical protein
MTNADQQAAVMFAAAVSRRDFRAAAELITNITNAGDPDLAALLLQGVIDAGVEAVEEMARTRTISVTQTIKDVPAGTTVIGFRADRLGR